MLCRGRCDLHRTLLTEPRESTLHGRQAHNLGLDERGLLNKCTYFDFLRKVKALLKTWSKISSKTDHVYNTRKKIMKNSFKW